MIVDRFKWYIIPPRTIARLGGNRLYIIHVWDCGWVWTLWFCGLACFSCCLHLLVKPVNIILISILLLVPYLAIVQDRPRTMSSKMMVIPPNTPAMMYTSSWIFNSSCNVDWINGIIVTSFKLTYISGSPLSNHKSTQEY